MALIQQLRSRFAIMGALLRARSLQRKGMPGWDKTIAELENQLAGVTINYGDFNAYSNRGQIAKTSSRQGGQARITLDPNNAVVITPENPSRNGILISVLSNATVYFSSDQRDVQNLDSTGTPVGGWPIIGPSIQPLVMKGFTNRLYGRSSAGQQIVLVAVAEYYTENSGA